MQFFKNDYFSKKNYNKLALPTKVYLMDLNINLYIHPIFLTLNKYL
jgi:hypothetical protein